MHIKTLSKEVVSKIRSSSSINNLSQCVTELVLNSLDAKSTAVAVRLNSIKFRIQVVDNGCGIEQEHFEKVALRYSTSKCQNLSDLEKIPKTYGYKGESLCNISSVSKTLIITSKSNSSENTFSKRVHKSKHERVTSTKKRQSNGTTIIIVGLFFNLPVRQKRMRKEFEIDILINFLESMSIIHPNVSFTLRDDISGKLLFKRSKSPNIIKSFIDLYPEIKLDETVMMKVKKDKVTVEALLTKNIFEKKPIQHIFVNKRPVHQPQLQAFISKELTKDSKKHFQSVKSLFPVFLVNIKCSRSNFHIIYENSEARVEFSDDQLIFHCVEKLTTNFFGKPNINKTEKEGTERKKSICGVSDLVGVVKGLGFKKWQERYENKMEETDFIEQSETPLEENNKPTFEKVKLKALPIEIFEQKTKKKNVAECQNNQKKCPEVDNIGVGFLVPTRKENIADSSMMNKFRRLEEDCRNILAKQKHEDTLFSNFTNTEEKGKNFLMYMFLKSTELFREGPSRRLTEEISKKICNESLNNSIETIMESNIFFQNITESKTHRLNENISVSVKLKRRRKLRVQDQFSEKYSFAYPEKKRKRNEFENENDHFCKEFQRTSPYFEGKSYLRRNFKRSSVGKQSMSFVMKSENSNVRLFDRSRNHNFTLINSSKTRPNVPKSVLNFGKHQISNFRFFNFTTKDSLNTNKSYFFDFGKICNAELTYEKQDDTLKIFSDEKRNLHENPRLASLEFRNLPFSPIPKIENSDKDPMEGFKYRDVPIGNKITTWRKYASEDNNLELYKNIGDYHKKSTFSSNNVCLARNRNDGQFFKRYKTEPVDYKKMQYIHKTKESIDKLFKDVKNGWHPFQNPYRYSSQNSLFTKDSLEENENSKWSPLWKKFIKKHDKYTENHRKKKDFSRISPQNSTCLSKKSKYIVNDMEQSPDLFSDKSIKNFINDFTFLPNSVVSFDIDKKVDINKNSEINDLRTLTASDTRETSNLIITLNENKKHFDNDNGIEINHLKTLTVLNTDACSNLVTEIEDADKKDTENGDGTLLNDEWIKNFNQEGTAYFYNQRTGMTSFMHPKQEEIYKVKGRPDFMPKGLSPVLIPDTKMEKFLSPISKTKLQDEILKAYSNDLGLVKWEKCFQGCDPKKFFDNLYMAKVNHYEKEVPKVGLSKTSKFFCHNNNEKNFNKTILKDLRVIGQIEQKFIVSIDEKKSQLIIFDQHAAHERVRLEDLLKEYDGKSAPCENITIFMKETDVQLVKTHENYLSSIGIRYYPFKNGISVSEVPLCFLNKVSKECPLPKLFQLVLREILHNIKQTRGVLTGWPRIMNEIINMEACKGSVKFGDLLSRAEMNKLIKKLSDCILPFQCAHGRPTFIPLLTLDKKEEQNVEKPTLRNLLKYK